MREFEKYAGFMTAQIDDLVDMWSTQNEPNVVAMPYNSIQMGFPPCIIAPDLGEKVLDNEAKAHNAAFDAMKKHTSKPVGCIYAIGIATGDEEA
ncbi:MAG TPA: family 1 glycosylhydrolase, partial [Thermotogota bacterium]|nr:family 1 glycosylhydrolase [Thermotogota bacterium]